MEEQKLRDGYPKISVVIPTYNSEKTLARLLSSIKEQTYSNTEIIIIDGVSKDNTLGIIEGYKDIVSYYTSEPDEGIYDAINKGIKAAKGDLVVIAGSDDYFCSNIVFEKIASEYKSDKYDIYAGRTIFKNKNGIDSYREDGSYGPESLIEGIPVGHNAMFVRKGGYNDVGLYDISYKICGDAQWVHRAIKQGKTLKYLDLDVINFSMDGTSSNNDDAIMEETYRVIRGNFPILSEGDAICIFKCYRGWVDRSLVISVIQKYQSDQQLSITLSKAFPEYVEHNNYSWKERIKTIISRLKNKFKKRG